MTESNKSNTNTDKSTSEDVFAELEALNAADQASQKTTTAAGTQRLYPDLTGLSTENQSQEPELSEDDLQRRFNNLRRQTPTQDTNSEEFFDTAGPQTAEQIKADERTRKEQEEEENRKRAGAEQTTSISTVITSSIPPVEPIPTVFQPNVPQSTKTKRPPRDETQEETELKNKLNTTGIFSPEKKALQNLETIHLYKEDQKTRIIIDSQDENVGVNVTEMHKQLAGTSKKSEFDVEIGDYKIAYKIDGKNVTADMTSMKDQEAAASDNAIKVTLTDADNTKYGNVSIEIDPQTMNPVLVSDKDPALTSDQMEEMKQDLIKTYGNANSKGKNATMTINGINGSVKFKDLGFMSQVEIEQKKQQVRDDPEATRNANTPKQNLDEVDGGLPGFGTAGFNRSTGVGGRPLGTSVRTTVGGVSGFRATSTQIQNEQELLAALKKSDDRRNSLENEIDRLEAQVNTLENDKSDLNKEAEILKLRITELETTLNERTQSKDEQIAKLETKIKELGKGINDKEEKINDFNRQIGALGQEVKDLKERINTLNQEKERDVTKKDEIDKTIGQLQGQITDKNNDLNNLRVELEKTIKERDDFKSELEKANSELTKLRNEKAQSEAQAQEQAEKYEAQQAQILKIAEKLGITIDSNNPNPDLSKLSEKINELKGQLDDKTREITLKDAQIEMSKGQINTPAEENDKLKKANETLLTQNKDLTSKNDLQTKEIDKLKAEFDKATQEIGSLKTQQGQSEKNNRDQQEKINKIAKVLGITIDPNKPISLDDLSGKIAEMQKKINDLEGEKNTLDAENKELTNKNTEQASEIEKLKAELAKAKEQNQKIGEALGIDPNDLGDNPNVKILDKIKQQKEENKYNKQLKNDLEQAKNDLEVKKTEIDNLNRKNNDQKNQIDTLNLENKSQKDKLDTQEKTIAIQTEKILEQDKLIKGNPSKDEVDKLKKRNSELETANIKHKETIKTLSNQINGLTEGNTKLKNDLENQKAEHKTALNKEKENGDKLNESNIKLQNELRGTKDNLNQANQKNNQLQGELDKANKENKTLTQENQQQKKQLDEYKNIASQFENLKKENSQLKNNAKADNKINDQFNKMCPNQASYQKYMDNLNGAIKKLSNDPNEKQTVETLKMIQNEYRNIARDRGYERHENNNLKNVADKIERAQEPKQQPSQSFSTSIPKHTNTSRDSSYYRS